MKKKLLSAIILSALVLSLAGCGNESTPDEPTSAESQNAADDDSTAEETTAPPETTEATTTTEAPKEIAKITSCDKFGNGDMLISDGDKNYVYSITDNKMYTGDDEIFDNIIAVGGKLALVRGDDKDYYYNLETNEKYDVAPLYSNAESIDEYNAVYKLEESFDGNVNYVGVISSNGEWVLPLSSDYEICQKDLYDIYSSLRTPCTGSLIWLDYYGVYDYKNDKIIDTNNSEFGVIGTILGDKILGDNLYNNLLEYNAQTGEVSLISKDCYSLYTISPYRGALGTNSNSALIWDNDGNIYDCDISDYPNINELCDLTDKYIIFSATNENHDYYMITANKDGSRIVEPIKNKSWSSPAYIYDDYAVLLRVEDTNNDENQYIINCTTGETTEYTNIDNFDPETGKLLIKTNGEYYIADVSVLVKQNCNTFPKNQAIRFCQGVRPLLNE